MITECDIQVSQHYRDNMLVWQVECQTHNNGSSEIFMSAQAAARLFRCDPVKRIILAVNPENGNNFTVDLTGATRLIAAVAEDQHYGWGNAPDYMFWEISVQNAMPSLVPLRIVVGMGEWDEDNYTTQTVHLMSVFGHTLTTTTNRIDGCA